MTDTNTGTMPDTEPPVAGAADTTESFAEHVFGSVLGAMELLDFEGPGEFYSVDFSRQPAGGGLVSGTATAFVYLSGYLLPAD